MGWIDNVKRAFDTRRLAVERRRMIVRDKWLAVVNA